MNISQNKPVILSQVFLTCFLNVTHQQRNYWTMGHGHLELLDMGCQIVFHKVSVVSLFH